MAKLQTVSFRSLKNCDCGCAKDRLFNESIYTYIQALTRIHPSNLLLFIERNFLIPHQWIKFAYISEDLTLLINTIKCRF